MTGDAMAKRKTTCPQVKKVLVLQPRDELIMVLASEFRFLSREQLQKLLDFPCVTRINIRLKKLYDHGYLSRFPLPTVAGKPKAIYYLGPQGVPVLAEKLGLDATALEKERKQMERTASFLNHQFFLNEVRIAFSLALKNQPQMVLERWVRDCLMEFPSSQRKVTTLRPDGCLCLTYQCRLYSFFVEADCSTMTTGRLKAKAQAYLDYARSGQSLQDFGFQYFRVLIITKTPARLLSLKATIEEQTDRLFYFSTRDQVCQEPILDRIWQRAGHQGLFSLLLEG